MPSLTWAEVDLSAIQHNLRRLRAITQTRVMAVVKANAYGHGAVPVARAAEAAGVDWLGVARAEEGLALRAAGLTRPILVLGHTPPDQAAEALGADLALTVWEPAAAQAYAAQARALNRAAALHVKIDTGMGRLGVLPTEAAAVIDQVARLDGARLAGVCTHFANADEAQPALSAAAQLAVFEQVIAALPARPPLLHASNSAGALSVPAARLDLVRCGIALYGLHPSPETPCPPDFRPALTWWARVTQVKRLPAGHGVSYGHQYITPRPETVAALGVGYADGYRRVLNVNEVVVHGQRAPVLGRVCMDQIIVRVDHLPAVRVGEAALLLGPGLPADELAAKWDTINYEVVCGIMARVPRVY